MSYTLYMSLSLADCCVVLDLIQKEGRHVATHWQSEDFERTWVINFYDGEKMTPNTRRYRFLFERRSVCWGGRKRCNANHNAPIDSCISRRPTTSRSLQRPTTIHVNEKPFLKVFIYFLCLSQSKLYIWGSWCSGTHIVHMYVLASPGFKVWSWYFLQGVSKNLIVLFVYTVLVHTLCATLFSGVGARMFTTYM